MDNRHVVFEGPIRSQILGADRLVRICLPASYREPPARRYPVLYVHDGQNAFSTVGDYVAFGWGNWQLDKTAHDLARAGQMQEIIIAAIDCSDERYREYRGPAASHGAGATPPADDPFSRYSRFLIAELKLRIDREYRTLPGPSHTATLGSSMGGVCSLALGWQWPNIFGKVASLSGAFQVERRALIRNLRRYIGPPKPLRVYLDSGVVDDAGGDDGCQHTEAVAKELRRIGWRDGIDLLRFTDEPPLTKPQLESAGLPREKWAEATASQHNEFYWRLRVWRALAFLFPLGKPNARNRRPMERSPAPGA